MSNYLTDSIDAVCLLHELSEVADDLHNDGMFHDAVDEIDGHTMTASAFLLGLSQLRAAAAAFRMARGHMEAGE